MTLEQILKLIIANQPVVIRLESGEEISGNADVLNNYICVELANAEVVEIGISNYQLKVWVKE